MFLLLRSVKPLHLREPQGNRQSNGGFLSLCDYFVFPRSTDWQRAPRQPSSLSSLLMNLSLPNSLGMCVHVLIGSHTPYSVAHGRIIEHEVGNVKCKSVCKRVQEDRWLVEIIADAVGDCLGETVLEGTASQQGGFAAVREVAHFDKDGGASGSGQDVVTGCLNSKAVQTSA